ncbi:hypothetical protein JX266_001188 [Neoarthrinium moseri]|uniref:uncharacterized protein n=1 Tax=Neoarthrinium moseri TaxID=1658444 RepID=UPI001FDC24C3|nr:uncharacterized protein JN550_002374 [Neoarthrinium moseri]KAI1854047.1 hypothetical protein JX266_001188 [Neoarthrinium moseri]KAI1874945.1 hypothetical protein JN550_002374 [Neoarthrinium moseri]
MAPRYDEAPEVAPHALPEVHQPPAHPEVAQYGQFPQQHQTLHPSIKREDSTFSGGAGGGYAPSHPVAPTYAYDHQSAYGTAQSDPGRQSKKATICGCTVLVFILSAIIAVLSAAVIGLAAGTGVEASRASDAESKLASGGATTTVTAPPSTATDFNTLDRNCTSNAGSTTGSSYTSTFFNQATYTIYCNKDTPNAPLQSLFVANLDDCMDACSSYSYYIPTDFPSANATNQTCSAVSFIPAWTNKTFATEGTAPGNCYLKGGTQNKTALYAPNNGQETHAAIVNES